MFHFIKNKNFWIFIFVSSALQIGCSSSSSSPSSSDVKKEIERIFSDCKSISVLEFEKLNGFAREDGRYTVSVSFSLEATPVAENKKLGKDKQSRQEEIAPIYEKTWSTQEKLRKEISSIEEMKTKLIAEYQENRDKLYDQANTEEQERMRLSSEEDRKLFLNSGEYASLSAKRDELEKQWSELRDEYYPIWGEYQYYNSFFKEASTIMKAQSALMKECKISFDSKFVRKIYSSLFKDGRSYLFGSEATFNADLSMIKTENGWVLEEFWNQ